MKTIVFFCIPAHGHTNPTLGVVRELVRRGHRVRYYSYEPFRDVIEAAGAEFVPCDDYDMERRISPRDAAGVGRDLAFSTKLLVDTTLALDEPVCRDMEELQPDCIVADSMAVWGKAVALKLGVPFVSSTTTFAFNRHSARIMPQGPGELLRLLAAMPAVSCHMRRLRRRGYPVKSILDILQNDDHTHTIVYTSRAFQPCGDTFSRDHYCFVGPSIRPASTVVEKGDEPLVYISMGTVNNAMTELYRSCIRGLTDCRLILSVGDRVNVSDLGPLPDRVSAYPQVDQIGVLKQADVFVTHCGMNSVSEALYHGVPLVMLPVTTEQKGVANRVVQLEAGVLLKDRTPAAIGAAVRHVLETPSFRRNARRISLDLQSCSGAKGAADKILSCCGET